MLYFKRQSYSQLFLTIKQFKCIGISQNRNYMNKKEKSTVLTNLCTSNILPTIDYKYIYL